MQWIIDTGTINTIRISNKDTVVGFIDNISFINPVRVGDILFYRTWIGRIRRSSMEVLVEVLKRGTSKEFKLASVAKLIFVAINEKIKPVDVNVRIMPRENWEKNIYEQLSIWREKIDVLINELKKRSVRKPLSLFRHSISTIRRVYYEDAMPGNIMYAGSLLRYIDENSGILASNYAKGPTVTASIDQIIFLRPIYVNDVIKITSMLTRTWRSSMEIKNIVSKISSENVEEVLVESYSTFVKLDIDGRPSPVDPLEPHTPEEYEEWATADERRSLRLKFAEKIEKYKEIAFEDIDIKDPKPMIENII